MEVYSPYNTRGTGVWVSKWQCQPFLACPTQTPMSFWPPAHSLCLHLPFLISPSSLSLSLTESRLMIIHFFFSQNITLLLLSTVTGLDCEFADPWWVYSLSCSLWHEIFWEGFRSAATLVQCLKVWRYDVKTDLNVGHVNMPPPFLH